jgi:hypothetical protein
VARDKKVRHLAAQIPDQATLDSLMLTVEDPFKRRVMFDHMKPFIRKFEPSFPTPSRD